ncbi:glycosyltransferase family 2 protein [Hufsiella ginkgonis]|uniref:Glycosyltransferase n=1 Tax=Hufsiella ginkgonis TaxID=2695274 RepID=A0A7K1XYU2_9SPHI|nr:glycosyltransferase family 2 protein [Hufsiella ginkgonis]MXV16164.1 glycosyltransferase [Hufsiella ginkgonis]
MRPLSIPPYILSYWNTETLTDAVFESVRSAYGRLRKGDGVPDVSIVIPAYNEEASIVKTLLSLSNNVTSRSVEIIVVNNNSKDSTHALVEKCGVTCILETTQGITPARNAGLAYASGKYILNADADSLYPDCWVEEMVSPLASDEKVAAVYGKFSFIPVGSTGRTVLFFYEYAADFMRMLNRRFKDEAVNMYGFNSGFRRVQGIEVDGFNHPPATNEDGWLATKLREKFGKLYQVSATRALVWTTDRRIQMDGGLWKGTAKRMKRMLGLEATVGSS